MGRMTEAVKHLLIINVILFFRHTIIWRPNVPMAIVMVSKKPQF